MPRPPRRPGPPKPGRAGFGGAPRKPGRGGGSATVRGEGSPAPQGPRPPQQRPFKPRPAGFAPRPGDEERAPRPSRGGGGGFARGGAKPFGAPRGPRPPAREGEREPRWEGGEANRAPRRAGPRPERREAPDADIRRPAAPPPRAKPAPRPADAPPGKRPKPDRRWRDAGAGAAMPGEEDPRPAASRPAEGGVWLYGLHAVAAALGNPARRLRRLLLTEAGRAALVPKMPPPWRIGPEPGEKEHLGKLLGAEAVHQGCALLVEPLEPPSLARLVEQSSGPILVLDQVTDPRNVGAILRSAAAFGAAALVVQERHAPGETGVLARAASGALEVVPMLREVNLARALRELKEAGLWVVGLDAGAPVTLAQAAAGLQGRRVALVLGAEGEGLRRLTRDTCDEMARLPISRAMESLNVSSAAAVALYELGRE